MYGPWIRMWLVKCTTVGLLCLVGVMLGPILSSAKASMLTSQAAAAVGLAAENSSCGDGVVYTPMDGGAMTPAEFEALGESVPDPGSPVMQSTTHWVVPQCSSLPTGEQPGGPTANPAPAVTSSTVTADNAGTATEYGSANWSGFQSFTGDTYNQAQAQWTVPSSYPTPPGDTYESSWAGLGSGASDSQSLLQAGTEVNVSSGGSVSTYAWWEFYPENLQQKISNLTINRGSTNYAIVTHSGYGTGSVQVCTEGSYWTCSAIIDVTWGTSYTIDTSEYECIAERTKEGATLPRLTNVSGIDYSNCWGYVPATSSWQFMGNWNRIYYYMSKNQAADDCAVSPWSMKTGDISAGSFPLDWIGYGWPIAAKACGIN